MELLKDQQKKMRQRLQMINKTLHNERGFTLIEMLVVLAIFMVISSSLLYVTTEKLTNYTNEQIIDQTEVLIRLAQIRAIETNSMYELYAFNCRDIKMRSSTNKDEILFEQTLPEGMELFISASVGKIRFLPNGNIRSAGSISYHLDGFSYNYSVNIGKGRLILKSVGQKPEGANTCGYTASARHPIFSNVNTRPSDS